jgi:hypothetical protein
MENPRLLAYIQTMRRDDVIAKLKETEPALRGFGVAAFAYGRNLTGGPTGWCSPGIEIHSSLAR